MPDHQRGERRFPDGIALRTESFQELPVCQPCGRPTLQEDLELLDGRPCFRSRHWTRLSRITLGSLPTPRSLLPRRLRAYPKLWTERHIMCWKSKARNRIL